MGNLFSKSGWQQNAITIGNAAENIVMASALVRSENPWENFYKPLLTDPATYEEAGAGLVLGFVTDGAFQSIGLITKNVISRIPYSVKPLRASGGRINGLTISKGSGYGAKPRFDIHPVGNPSKRSNSMPQWTKGRTLPHYHRGKGNALHRHRPWEKSPNDKKFLDRF